MNESRKFNYTVSMMIETHKSTKSLGLNNFQIILTDTVKNHAFKLSD